MIGLPRRTGRAILTIVELLAEAAPEAKAPYIVHSRDAPPWGIYADVHRTAKGQKADQMRKRRIGREQ